MCCRICCLGLLGLGSRSLRGGGDVDARTESAEGRERGATGGGCDRCMIWRGGN